MLNRSLPPPSYAVDQVNLIEAVPFKLDNGVPGHYINAGAQPVIRLEFIFNAGKKYQQLPGVSYFTGKMLQEGTATWNAKELNSTFDSLGAFLEVVPGFDYITVTIHHLTKHLQQLLPVIKEILYQPLLGLEELNNLKQIKYQQLQVDLQRNNFVASREFRKILFGEDHPYGRNLDLESIKTIQNQHLKAHFDQYMSGDYQIIASGQISEAQIDLINQSLGEEPYDTITASPQIPISYREQEVLIEKEDSMQSSIRVGMPTISRDHEDYWKLAVVNEILGGYFGSRLMKNIREEKGYTYGIHSALSHLNDHSMFFIGTEVKKAYRAHTIYEIHREIKKLQRDLIEWEELQTVTNYMAGAFASEVDSPFAIADKFKTLHFSGLNYSHYGDLFDTLKTITPHEVLEVAGKYLDPQKFSSVVVG